MALERVDRFLDSNSDDSLTFMPPRCCAMLSSEENRTRTGVHCTISFCKFLDLFCRVRNCQSVSELLGSSSVAQLTFKENPPLDSRRKKGFCPSSPTVNVTVGPTLRPCLPVVSRPYGAEFERQEHIPSNSERRNPSSLVPPPSTLTLVSSGRTLLYLQHMPVSRRSWFLRRIDLSGQSRKYDTEKQAICRP